MQRNIPFALSMGGCKGARLSYDPASSRLCLLLPESNTVDHYSSPFSEISFIRERSEGANFAAISITNPSLFAVFHQLTTLVTLAFDQEGVSPTEAFDEAIASWRNLVVNLPLLSDTAQLGLFGELQLLKALIMRLGKTAVLMWTAYGGETTTRHDFRWSDIEIEVKTTSRRRRSHHINGITQLVPSPNRTLYVLSLMYERAGFNSGLSLPELISDVRARLPLACSERLAFETKLLQSKFRDADANHYTESLAAASPPKLILVDQHFPRITPELLCTSLKSDLYSRIDHLQYEVDLEGLGVGEESLIYKEILQGAQLV